MKVSSHTLSYLIQYVLKLIISGSAADCVIVNLNAFVSIGLNLSKCSACFKKSHVATEFRKRRAGRFMIDMLRNIRINKAASLIYLL